MPRGRKSNAMKEAEIIVSVMKESGVLSRILNRQHILNEDKEDIESSLYLEWLEKPEGLIRAQEGGFLVQYATTAVRNKVANLRRRREVCVPNEALMDYEDC